MKLEDIQAGIAQDAEIDKTRLDAVSINTPSIHAKWMRILAEERVIARGIEIELNKLKRDRTLYYMGKLDDDAYREEPLQYKVLKQDLDLWLDADPKLNDLKNKAYTQALKITAIEAFLKDLSQRTFHIKNAIEFIKFQNGVA